MTEPANEEMRKVEVEVRLADDAVYVGVVHLADDVRVLDFMNDATPFFALTESSGRVRIFAKSQVMQVIPHDRGREPRHQRPTPEGATMAATIDYYLALSSPWTYLAGPRFAALVERNSLKVTLKPFDIMHVFKVNGTKVVGERPKPVQANRLRELARWRDYLDMPLNLHPAHFPVNATMAGRMVIAAQEAGTPQDRVIDLSFAHLRACWAEERDLADEATLTAIADACGLDGAALLAAAKGDAAAEIFARNTDDALANEVFGSPTWVCNGELFWGQDRLDFLARLVEGA